MVGNHGKELWNGEACAFCLYCFEEIQQRLVDGSVGEGGMWRWIYSKPRSSRELQANSVSSEIQQKLCQVSVKQVKYFLFTSPIIKTLPQWILHTLLQLRCSVCYLIYSFNGQLMECTNSWLYLKVNSYPYSSPKYCYKFESNAKFRQLELNKLEVQIYWCHAMFKTMSFAANF